MRGRITSSNNIILSNLLEKNISIRTKTLNKTAAITFTLVFFFTLFQDFYRKYVIEHELEMPKSYTIVKRGLEIV